MAAAIIAELTLRLQLKLSGPVVEVWSRSISIREDGYGGGCWGVGVGALVSRHAGRAC
ncbi:hypothetical protein J6590_005721 [Homalodisca vitripennis]|nr:hypothetical protein J6590_005721 [Homalodisca vitripennis]